MRTSVLKRSWCTFCDASSVPTRGSRLIGVRHPDDDRVALGAMLEQAPAGGSSGEAGASADDRRRTTVRAPSAAARSFIEPPASARRAASAPASASGDRRRVSRSASMHGVVHGQRRLEQAELLLAPSRRRSATGGRRARARRARGRSGSRGRARRPAAAARRAARPGCRSCDPIGPGTILRRKTMSSFHSRTTTWKLTTPGSASARSVSS